MVKDKFRKGEIDELIASYDQIVEKLENMAANQEIDPETFKKLSMLGDNGNIMTALCLNPKAPSKFLEKMLDLHDGAGGTDDEWRIHIVWNPNLREVILRRIMKKDSSIYIREIATLMLSKKLLQNPDANPNQVLNLYKHIEKISNQRLQEEADKTRMALQNHPKFPVDINQG